MLQMNIKPPLASEARLIASNYLINISFIRLLTSAHAAWMKATTYIVPGWISKPATFNTYSVALVYFKTVNHWNFENKRNRKGNLHAMYVSKLQNLRADAFQFTHVAWEKPSVLTVHWEMVKIHVLFNDSVWKHPEIETKNRISGLKWTTSETNWAKPDLGFEFWLLLSFTNVICMALKLHQIICSLSNKQPQSRKKQICLQFM